MGFNVLDTLSKLATESGFAGFFAAGGWQNLVMIVVACVLLYLGIVKGFEPLLLVGIAFGCLLANVSYFPGLDAVNSELNATNALYHPELWEAFLDKNSEFYRSSWIPAASIITATATFCRMRGYLTSSTSASRQASIPRSSSWASAQ